MAGEAPILVQSFDNVGLINPNPNSVLEIDSVNSDVYTTAVKLPTAAGSECIGVQYDRAKLDPTGTPYKNSGFSVRMHGIARCIASGAVNPGDFVSVADNTGRVHTQAASTNGSVLVSTVTLSPASVAANTTAEQTFAVTGLLTTDVIVGVSKPTAQAGLAIGGWRVASAGNIGITFINDTGAPIVPTATEVYSITIARGATAGTALGAVPIVGRCLSKATGANDQILVFLMIGQRV